MSYFPWTHIAGDTLDFEVEVPDYPSTDGWTLTYYLTPRFATPTQAQIVIVASANADGTYQIQQSPAQTAGWKVGAYGWHRAVSKVGARQTLTSSADQGEVEVKQDPATATQGYDSRSHARKVLDSLRAAYEGRSLTAQQREMVSYTIGSRSQTFSDTDSRTLLEDSIARYAWIVSDEDNKAAMAAGKPNRRTVGLSFRR